MYLIIGASSFIGRHLYDCCKKKNIDVLGTYCTHSYYKEWIKFDICSDELNEIWQNNMNGKLPDAVIICGANSKFDSCKKDEEASNRLNVIGTKRILEQASSLGIKTVFFSSEAVFDGEKGFYSEDDVPNPIVVYGQQKLQIEHYMIRYLNNYLILRISKAVGSCYGEEDIFDEFYNKIVKQEDILCLKNRSFCITEVGDIAEVVVRAIEQDLNGLYHLASENYISRYELAKLYANKMFGGYERIEERGYDDFSFLDNRYIYGGLDGRKLTDLLGIHYMSLEEILNNYAKTYQPT